MRVTLRFAWYDLWVGAYVDTAGRRLYVCPLPCVLITAHLPAHRGGEARPATASDPAFRDHSS